MMMVYCTCNVSSLSGLIEIIDELGLSNYQILSEVTGRSVKGEPRMNTPVWPGHNSSVILQLHNDDVEKIMDRIKKYNTEAYNENELITYCSWPLSDYFYE